MHNLSTTKLFSSLSIKFIRFVNTSNSSAGRNCPLKYRYNPSVLKKKQPDFIADTIYVIGGLYGNVQSLETILDMKKREENKLGTKVSLIFNGDFNWFNSDPFSFKRINEEVQKHLAIKGNVEEEISNQEQTGAGCGCGYPEYVDQGTVDRSNIIIEKLRHVGKSFPESLNFMKSLPMYLSGKVGKYNVGILHGDPYSLAGWKFSVELMEPLDIQLRRNLNVNNDNITTEEEVKKLFSSSSVQVFACTHTCLPFAQTFKVAERECTIINNGSSGMPNFKNTRFGLFSRISSVHIDEKPENSVYGNKIEGLRLDSIAIPYDSDAFIENFLKNWPEKSPAHVSYFRRIFQGPNFHLQQASRRGFNIYNSEFEKYALKIQEPTNVLKDAPVCG